MVEVAEEQSTLTFCLVHGGQIRYMTHMYAWDITISTLAVLDLLKHAVCKIKIIIWASTIIQARSEAGYYIHC